MGNQSEQQSFELFLKNNLYLLSAYCISVGSLYLWAYWSHFAINILEHIAVTDIVKLTAYPICYVSILVASSTLVVGIGWRERPTQQYYRFRGRDIIITIVVIGAFFASIVYYFSLTNMRWILISLLLSCPFMMLATNTEYLKTEISNKTLRRMLIYFFVVVPFLSWGFGKTAASSITNGRHYSYLVSAFGNYPSVEHIQNQPRIIGITGEKIFLYVPTKGSILISRLNDDQIIEFKKYSVDRTPLSKIGDWATSFFTKI